MHHTTFQGFVLHYQYSIGTSISRYTILYRHISNVNEANVVYHRPANITERRTFSWHYHLQFLSQTILATYDVCTRKRSQNHFSYGGNQIVKKNELPQGFSDLRRLRNDSPRKNKRTAPPQRSSTQLFKIKSYRRECAFSTYIGS